MARLLRNLDNPDPVLNDYIHSPNLSGQVSAGHSKNVAWNKYYLSPAKKLMISLFFAIAWVFVSAYLAVPWIKDLSASVGSPIAITIITGIALIPGFGIAFSNMSLVLDRRPEFSIPKHLPSISILVAAFNEMENIYKTLHSISRQQFPGNVEVIVIDDGSSDNTIQEVNRFIEDYTGSFDIRLKQLSKNSGKSSALNNGLAISSHDIIITIDADTTLYKNALANLVANLVQGPQSIVAVAGTMLVRNSRKNFMTRMQEWDYFLGISVNKRTQSLYQGTLVAQGAFSAYYKSAIQQVGGWSNTVGEDIVLTWGLRGQGMHVSYAENAFAFTNVPETYQNFFRQRTRWSRGLMEGFFTHPRVIRDLDLNSPFIWLNMLFPFIDLIFLFVFVPGIIGAIFFKFYAIAGVMTLTLLPLMALIGLIMFKKQRQIFRKYGLRVRRNIVGLICYMLFYQVIMVPACLVGYFSEFINLNKKW